MAEAVRRAARQDDNHGAIRDALRRMGMTVKDTSRMGDGFPDLVGCMFGQTALIEVKDGAKPLSKRRLTPKEQEFRDEWVEAGGLYRVVESVEDAEHLIEELRRRANAEEPEGTEWTYLQ